MPHKILLTATAKHDLRQIANYTRTQWGEAKMISYMAELKVSILKLSTENAGKNMDYLSPGLRAISHRSHYHIFFKIDRSAIKIIRILHQRRDWEALLSSD